MREKVLEDFELLLLDGGTSCRGNLLHFTPALIPIIKMTIITNMIIFAKMMIMAEMMIITKMMIMGMKIVIIQ